MAVGYRRAYVGILCGRLAIPCRAAPGAASLGLGGQVAWARALAPNGIDAVLDVAGQGALPDSIELRGGTERIVTLADPAAYSLGVVFSAGGGRRPAEDLVWAVDQLARGELTTTVAAVFSFAEAAQAHRLVDGGHAGGKVVLVP